MTWRGLGLGRLEETFAQDKKHVRVLPFVALTEKCAFVCVFFFCDHIGVIFFFPEVMSAVQQFLLSVLAHNDLFTDLALFSSVYFPNRCAPLSNSCACCCCRGRPQCLFHLAFVDVLRTRVVFEHLREANYKPKFHENLFSVSVLRPEGVSSVAATVIGAPIIKDCVL